jgi:hypothetical protein
MYRPPQERHDWRADGPNRDTITCIIGAEKEWLGCGREEGRKPFCFDVGMLRTTKATYSRQLLCLFGQLVSQLKLSNCVPNTVLDVSDNLRQIRRLCRVYQLLSSILIYEMCSKFDSMPRKLTRTCGLRKINDPWIIQISLNSGQYYYRPPRCQSRQ